MSVAEQLDSPEQPQVHLHLVEQPPENQESDLDIIFISDGEVPGGPMDWFTSQLIAGYRQEIRSLPAEFNPTGILSHAGVKFEAVRTGQIRSIYQGDEPSKVHIRFKEPVAGKKTFNKVTTEIARKHVTVNLASLADYVDSIHFKGKG